MGRRPLPKRITALDPRPLTLGTTCGISSPFGLLFHTSGQVTYVLRTHSPLRDRIATISSFDLHVLSTPPAFILSQDQTLRRNFLLSSGCSRNLNGDDLVVLLRREATQVHWSLPITLQLLRCRLSRPASFFRRLSGRMIPPRI